MENESKGWSFIIFAIVVIGLFVGVTAARDSIKESGTNELRQKCNQTVLTDGKLSEQTEDFYYSSIDEEGTSTASAIQRTKKLEFELANTNKEVNKLRSLLSCYFDKF